MDLEEGEIVISDSESEHGHYEYRMDSGKSVERPKNALKHTSPRSRPNCHLGYPLGQFINLRDGSSNRRSHKYMTSTSSSCSIYQRGCRGPKYEDFNKEIMLSTSVTSSVNQTYSINCTKKRRVSKSKKSSNLFKRKSSNRNKEEMEKQLKESHKNHLLKKVISKSGPRSVPSSTVVSHENRSLMSKLITAGLAKKSSDTEMDVETLVLGSEMNNCNSPSVNRENKTERNLEEDGEDSEIEVIIPPKKVYTVVTLDSDGEEVTNTFSEIKLSTNLENSLNDIQLNSIASSKASNSLFSVETANDQNLHCKENLSLRSNVSPLCLSASEDGSISLPFTPSSPSSCNSIETNLNQVAETLVKLKNQTELEAANQILPIIKPNVRLCEENHVNVDSQKDVTSIANDKDSHLNLNCFSCNQKNPENKRPISDSILNCNSNASHMTNESDLEENNGTNIKVCETLTTENYNKPCTTTEESTSILQKNTADIALCHASMLNVFGSGTEQLVSENLDNLIIETEKPTNLPLNLDEVSNVMDLTHSATEIHTRPHDNNISKIKTHKDTGIIYMAQNSNLIDQTKEYIDKQELESSNTLCYNKNITHGISDISTDIIDTTSSFLSLKNPVLKDLNTAPDYVGCSGDGCILEDSSSNTTEPISPNVGSKQCAKQSHHEGSRQHINTEKNECNGKNLTHETSKKYSKGKITENVDSDDEDDDLSKLRLLALSSKGKPNLILTDKEDNANCLENVSQSNTSADETYENEEEDILLLRVAALKSAVIKKHEQRKKKGLLVKKKNRLSVDLGSMCDETILFSKDTSNSKVPLNNIANPSQNANLLSNSPTESLQGEEDMEISDSGDTSDNQEKPTNNLSESLEPGNFKSTPNVSYLPFGSEPPNMFTSIIPAAQQPHGIAESVGYSAGCISDLHKNYSQPISAVLPPPPPPPVLIFNSLLSPPPPPPLPEIEEPPTTLYQYSANIGESQVQSDNIYNSYQEPKNHSSNDFATTVYNSKNNAKLIFLPSQNENNIKKTVHPIEEFHENLQTIEITSAASQNPQQKMRPVNKFKPAPNDPQRRNLRKIPLAKDHQNITSKNKLRRLRRRIIRGKTQVESAQAYNESNSLSASCAKSAIPLCITNTPIKQIVNSDCPKHNFPLCTTDSSVLKIKKNVTVEINPSTLLCTENSNLIGDGRSTTNKFVDGCTNQISYSPNNKKSDWESEEDGKSHVRFQDEEMDLSNMIVLDEVGMSPEHKSNNDHQCSDGAVKGPIEDDEDYLRINALSSLSTKHGLSKSFGSISPHSKSDLCEHFSGASRISKTLEHESLVERDQACGNKKDFKNFSIIKKVNDCDSSMYKLTRVVTKEPCRSVVKGRDSLKVVIPTETTPLLNSPQSFSVPVIERFVISVGKDSDSEEEGEWLRRVKVHEKPVMSTPDLSKDYDLERSVDLLLSSTRQRIENTLPAQTKSVAFIKNFNKSLTPNPKKNLLDDSSETPLHLLPKERQEEYMRLKKIIDEKEKQKQQKYLGNRQKCQDSLRSSTKHSEKLLSPKCASTDGQIQQTSPSLFDSEGKSSLLAGDKPNASLPKENISYKRKVDKALKQQTNQRDCANLSSQIKPSRVELSPKEKIVFMSKVENYLKKVLDGKSNDKFIKKTHTCFNDKTSKIKLSKGFNTKQSKSINIENPISKKNIIGIQEDCVTTSKIVPQGFKESNDLINNKCEETAYINRNVLEEVSKGNLNENYCETMESDVPNFNSGVEVKSKISIPNKSYDQDALSKKTSETVQCLNKDYLKSLENYGLDLNTYTKDSLQIPSNYCKQQNVKRSLLCSTSRKKDNVPLEASSNISSLENVSTSMRNDSLDKELMEKEMSSSKYISPYLDFNNENVKGVLQREACHEVLHKSVVLEKNTTISELGKKNLEDLKLQPLALQVSNESSKNSSDAELLFSKQEELLSERFALMNELSDVSESMGKLEIELAREGSLVADIEKLRCKLLEAEQQLQKQKILTSHLELGVNIAQQAACKRHSLVSSLETSCQQLGCRLRGPNYLTPVRGKDLLEKKMKQMLEKKNSLETKKETQRSCLESLRSGKNECQIWDSKSSSKDNHSLVDKQASMSEKGGSSVVAEPTTFESNSSNSIYTSSLPVSNFSQSQRKINQNLEDRQIKDDFSLQVNQCQDMISSNTSSFDSTSNNKYCCKKPRLESKKGEADEAKSESKLNLESVTYEKNYDKNSSNVISNCDKPRTSKLHYKSVLQFKSNSGKRKDTSQSLASSGNVLCPYDLMGQCQDSQCQYQHLAS